MSNTSAQESEHLNLNSLQRRLSSRSNADNPSSVMSSSHHHGDQRAAGASGVAGSTSAGMVSFGTGLGGTSQAFGAGGGNGGSGDGRVSLSTSSLVLPKIGSGRAHQLQQPQHLQHSQMQRSDETQDTHPASGSASAASGSGSNSSTARLSHEARKLIRQQTMKAHSLASLENSQQAILSRLSTMRIGGGDSNGSSLGSLPSPSRAIGGSDVTSPTAAAGSSTALVVADPNVRAEIEQFDWMSLIEDPLKGKPKLTPMDRLEAGRYVFERDPDEDDGIEQIDDDFNDLDLEDDELGSEASKLRQKIKDKPTVASEVPISSKLGSHIQDLTTYDRMISLKEEELDMEMAKLADQRARWDRKLARISHQAQERRRALLAKDSYLNKIEQRVAGKRADASKPLLDTTNLEEQEISKLADTLRKDLGGGQGLDEVGDIGEENTSSAQGEVVDEADIENPDDYFGFDVDTIIAQRAAEARQKKQEEIEARRRRREEKQRRRLAQKLASKDMQDDETLDEPQQGVPNDKDTLEGLHNESIDPEDEDEDEDLDEEADDIDDPLATLTRLYQSWGIKVPMAGDDENTDEVLKSAAEDASLSHLLERRLQGGLGAISAQLDDLIRARNELIKEVDLTGISDDEEEFDPSALIGDATGSTETGHLLEHIPDSTRGASAGLEGANHDGDDDDGLTGDSVFVTASASARSSTIDSARPSRTGTTRGAVSNSQVRSTGNVTRR